MTDISLEECNLIGKRFQQLGEYETINLEGYSLWDIGDTILALRAALDAAEADKARAVEAEREAAAGLAMQWVEGDCTCPRCLDATHIAAAICARGAKP